MDIWNHGSDMMLDRRSLRNRPEFWSARSGEGMVATAHYLATSAGAEILGLGGNAVDAAIASSLALGVCEPAGSGLGGMAMMVVHIAAENRTFMIPGPCRAPRAATPELVGGAGRYRGYRAVAVPGLPSVLDHAHERYGSLGREALFGPAIRLAEAGFPVTPLQHSLIGQYRRPLSEGTAGSHFLGGDGNPLPAGHVLRRPALARTLERLAGSGFGDFYLGETARLIAKDMERCGGFITAADLESFPSPGESTPVSVPFLGSVLHVAGPPAGGIALAEMAGLFDALRAPDPDPDTPEGAILMARIIRKAREDRRRFRLRTGAEEAGEAGELVSPGYLSETAALLLDGNGGGGETSHLVTADGQGSVVSMTQSVERSFGSAEVGTELGFLYNGFMRAYKVKNRRHPHFLRPGAPARSNASPAIVIRDGAPRAAVGSTGSERMASGILQVLVRLSRQDPFEAVLAPRLHCTPEGVVQIEADRFSPSSLAALEKAGFTLEKLDPYSFSMGGLQLLTRVGGKWCGVGEPRRDSAASGPTASEQEGER